MISKTIARYVWLLNTLIEEKSLTFEEIDLFSGKKLTLSANPLLIRF